MKVSWRSFSAQVGEDDGLDGHPADGAQLVPPLQLPGADVAGHEVSGLPVDDAAVFGSGLADETRVQTRVRQPEVGRHAALQVRHRVLGVARRRRLGLGRPELLLGERGGGSLGGAEGILGVWGGAVGPTLGVHRRFRSFPIRNVDAVVDLHIRTCRRRTRSYNWKNNTGGGKENCSKHRNLT